jgi:hypothetical protein
MEIKKPICAALLCTVLATSISSASLAEDITVKLDGKVLEMSVPARIENDRTFVPMRSIFEAFGMEVSWNDEEKSVTATNGEDTVKMTIGKNEIVKNDDSIDMDVSPIIRDDSTLVPVRAVSECLDAEVSWDAKTKTVEIESEEYRALSDAWKENTGNIDLSLMSVSGSGITVEDNVIEITEGGDFTVTGENDNAMIHVNTSSRVKLRLSGMSLANKSGPAIYFENVDKAFITLSKGTENFISDSEEYENEAKAALYSTADIEIKGSGSLTVESASHHAIASKDDVKIEEGTIVLKSLSGDGIHAGDNVKILGGNVTISSDGDGIQAEKKVVVEDGTLNITTTGEVETSSQGFGGGFGKGERPDGNSQNDSSLSGEQSNNGNQPGDGRNMGGNRPGGTPPEMNNQNVGMQGGEQQGNPPEMGERPNEQPGQGTQPDFKPDGEQPGEPPEGQMSEPPEGKPDGQPEQGEKPDFKPDGEQPNEESGENDESSSSSKGIKGETGVEISGGEIVINSTDHAIHSSADMNISGGKLTLESQKAKGISAHGNLTISNGEVDITKSTEGIESKSVMTISGGKISVTASDDGINCGGTEGRDVASRNDANAETEHDMFITGGEIYVNAAGDGLDSNGRLIISGGSIVVEGPTNSGNGALDSGGVITVTGGTLFAIGASGMAEAPGSASSQASFSYTLDSNYTAGTKISVSDKNGKELISYTTTKTGNNVIFSSPSLEVGETYTLTVGDNSYEVSLTSVTTSNGGNSRGFGGGAGNGGGSKGFGGGNGGGKQHHNETI